MPDLSTRNLPCSRKYGAFCHWRRSGHHSGAHEKFHTNGHSNEAVARRRRASERLERTWLLSSSTDLVSPEVSLVWYGLEEERLYRNCLAIRDRITSNFAFRTAIHSIWLGLVLHQTVGRFVIAYPNQVNTQYFV